jgi:hypothetical protein
MLCGALWLFSTLFGWEIDFNYVWPIFLFIPGAAFWGSYFLQGRKDWGLVIPATILTGLSLTFWLNTYVQTNYDVASIWAITAFMYPGSVAAALWFAWLASNRKFGILIAAVITTCVTLFVFCSTTIVMVIGDERFATANRIIWPIVIIGMGAIMLFTPLIRKILNDEEKQEKPEEAEILEEH